MRLEDQGVDSPGACLGFNTLAVILAQAGPSGAAPSLKHLDPEAKEGWR
jgi:hypothetical protein